METLVVRPQTVEEISEDNLKYLNLHEQKGEVRYNFIISKTKTVLKKTKQLHSGSKTYIECN